MSIKENKILHEILIVGGGAGGLELATKLGDDLGKKKKANITLVDAKKTHVWKPLLHEIAAGSLNPEKDELDYLAQGYWHNFKFRLGRMVGLDRNKKEVILESFSMVVIGCSSCFELLVSLVVVVREFCLSEEGLRPEVFGHLVIEQPLAALGIDHFLHALDGDACFLEANLDQFDVRLGVAKASASLRIQMIDNRFLVGATRQCF